jgi:hypothetical protein
MPSLNSSLDCREPSSLISDRRTRSRALAGTPYAVTQDGKRFLVATASQQSTIAPLTVVLAIQRDREIPPYSHWESCGRW